jgi:ligand-binding SRPBCC domain-containing protein
MKQINIQSNAPINDLKIDFTMKIYIETEVEQNWKEVWKRFDKQLFIKLSPTFPTVNILQFDGCKQGDVVKLEINFVFFKQIWKSNISENVEKEDSVYFVDVGTELPFFLKNWHHQHLIIKKGEKTLIVDNITFQSYTFLNWFVYPFLYLQFWRRKPIYRNYFKK